MLRKECDEFMHSPIIVICNNNVININKKIDHCTIGIEDKKLGVCMRVDKARDDKKLV